jgi:glyoxylase-like metal-dependent hydrolase (beta-lactamase superfamily II)
MGSRRVVHGVFQLPHPISNSYVLDGGDGLVLIDTGYRGRALEARREVDRAARSIARDLTAIAITHAHADHTGGLAGLAAEFDVPILAGALDAPAIRAGHSVTGEPTGILGRLMRVGTRRMTVDPARVDILVDEGDPIPGAPALRVIATPGHTPGHLSFLWPAEGGVLFAGDIAFHALGLRESFVHADREAARLSLAKVAALDFEVAVFGHGPPFVGGAVARFRRLVERQARAATR